MNQDNSDILTSTLSAGRKQFKLKNYPEALKIFLGVVHSDATAELCVDIGSCYYMQNDYKEALTYWQKAIQLDNKYYKAYTNIGNMHYKSNQLDNAISFWLYALVYQPEDAQTCLNLAVTFDKKGMRFEAIKYFEKYIKYEENKNSDEYIRIKKQVQNCCDIANQYLAYGVKAQSEGNNEQAAACYFKSLANYPNFSKTNLNLGSIFFGDKNLDLAIKYWRTSAHIEPNYDKIYSNLAISYDLKKEFDYAYAYYHMYTNYLFANKEEFHKVRTRLINLKSYLNTHQDLIEKHLERAQAHILKSEIYEALDEYRIYTILRPEKKDEIAEKIKSLELFVYPEGNVINECFEEGNRLIKERNYGEAKHLFWRIMRLSAQNKLEYSKAKALYSQCEKAQLGQF